MVLDFNTLYNYPSRFDRMFENFFKSSFSDERRMAYPLLDLSNDDENIYVRAEVPGIAIDDLEITLTDASLVIKGERVSQEGKFYRQERRNGVFNRVINISVPVDRDRVTASMVDGILTVTLPKSEEVRPRTIAIDVQ